MEASFFSKDVDILTAVEEVAWWQWIQASGHLNRNKFTQCCPLR